MFSLTSPPAHQLLRPQLQQGFRNAVFESMELALCEGELQITVASIQDDPELPVVKKGCIRPEVKLAHPIGPRQKIPVVEPCQEVLKMHPYAFTMYALPHTH